MSTEGTERRFADTGVSENEERLQEIFSQVAVGIAQIGLDGAWLLVNKRYCEMLGYSEAELRGKTLQEITHPDDWNRTVEARRQLLAGEISSDTFEKRYIRKDGTVFWGRLHRSLVRDRDGRPKYCLAVVEDITGKIQTERALRESEQRLTLAESAAHMAVWDRELSTSVITVSSEYSRIYGLPADTCALTFEEWIQLIHPEDRDRVRERNRDALTRTHVWDEEFRIVWPDGSVHWLLGKGTVFRDEAGRPVRIAGVNIEITHHKQMEEALRQSEERFRLAVQATNDAVWDIDVATGTVQWNETYATLFGRPPETSGSVQWWIDRIHPEDRGRTAGGLRTAIDGDASSWTCEYRIRRADGAWAYIYDRAYIARDASGKARRAIGAMQDLTERKKAEAALRESEERFRATFFQAAVGIAQTGPDGQWLLINDRFCEMLGYSQAELREKSFPDITHPDDREATLTAVGKLLAGEISCWLKEKRYIRKDGVIFWGRLFTSLVRDQDKQPQYFISVVADITEQKLIEERLRASEHRLMEAQRLAKVGSWERDIETGTIHWSEEMLRILGPADAPPANLTAFLNYVHPKDREKISESYEKVRSSMRPVEVEYRIIRPDGEGKFLRSIVEGVRDDQGVLVRITGATQDITEQVKARELLRESEGHLKNAARLAHVGYWQWELQTNRVSGSDEMFRIFGKPERYTPSYGDFVQTVIPQDRERVSLWVNNCLAEKRGVDIEYQIAWPNGDLRTISCIAELLLGEDGMPMRMFGACQDITDFKRAQQQSLARQKLESIGTLASGIAHDFNNLLGAVAAQAELGLGELAAGLRPEEELMSDPGWGAPGRGNRPSVDDLCGKR